MLALLDYGAGNIRSVEKALLAVGADVRRFQSADGLEKASGIVLPGVGAFDDCLNALQRQELNGAIRSWIADGRPFLGICVGMQLMASRGLEHDVTEGFGWIPGDVMRISPPNPSFKIPHMGWNTLDLRRPHALLDGIALGEQGLHAYFVHSYHLVPRDPSHVVATTEHGSTITAVVGRDNMAGTQFHPEKSQQLGLRLLANFLRWRP